jgi:hypothetical protein
VKANDKQSLDIEDSIDRLNLLWAELLRVYAIKEKLPLAGLDTPYYPISADWQEQRIQIRNHYNQWKGKMTDENIAAFRAIREEINGLKQKVNSIISLLCMEEVTVVSLGELIPIDLLLFSEETASLAPKLEEIKAQKARFLKQKKYERACYYRGEEKAILEVVAKRFEKDYPGLYFKASWYREREIVFLPTGNWEMRALIERISRSAYKNN